VEEAAPTRVAGPPVGLFEGHDYACCQVRLQPGDGLLLFSDGVTEAMDARGRQFKPKGVHAVLGGGALSPREMGERLHKAVKQHASGCAQHDDITVVCFGRPGEGHQKKLPAGG